MMLLVIVCHQYRVMLMTIRDTHNPNDKSSRTMALTYLEHCTDKIRQWMLSHYFAINDSKTDIFVAETPQQLTSSGRDS